LQMRAIDPLDAEFRRRRGGQFRAKVGQRDHAASGIGDEVFEVAHRANAVRADDADADRQLGKSRCLRRTRKCAGCPHVLMKGISLLVNAVRSSTSRRAIAPNIREKLASVSSNPFIALESSARMFSPATAVRNDSSPAIVDASLVPNGSS